jgi:hypothetical protein
MASNNAPRRVDFRMYEEDFECAYLGALGRSTRNITARTKLTPGKVTYRLRKAHIRRIDYRDGTSDIALMVEDFLRSRITMSLYGRLG